MNSMMNYKSKELATMKIIKDILMVLVVLYHSMLCSAGGDWGPEEAYNTSRALYYISSYLNRIHIYAFTFVSGYIFSYLYFETDRYYDFCIVIRKKIKRLIIPYVSTMVLWVVPFYCFFWKPEAKILIKKFVLGTSKSTLVFTNAILAVCSFSSSFFKNISKEENNNCVGICFRFVYIWWNDSWKSGRS